MNYKVKTGQRVEQVASNAISLAKKHDRKVSFRFNDLKFTVNKRLSVKHIVATYSAMWDARKRRWEESAEGKLYKQARQRELEKKNAEIDFLFTRLPKSKQAAMGWLSHWIPLSDDREVKSRKEEVVSLLLVLGFIPDRHVGAIDPNYMSHVEYVGGQVLSMLQRIKCVAPDLAYRCRAFRDTPQYR
jgi:hypothetical protein